MYHRNLGAKQPGRSASRHGPGWFKSGLIGNTLIQHGIHIAGIESKPGSGCPSPMRASTHGTPPQSSRGTSATNFIVRAPCAGVQVANTSRAPAIIAPRTQEIMAFIGTSVNALKKKRCPSGGSSIDEPSASMLALQMLFRWGCGAVGSAPRCASRRSWVRIPSAPPIFKKRQQSSGSSKFNHSMTFDFLQRVRERTALRICHHVPIRLQRRCSHDSYHHRPESAQINGFINLVRDLLCEVAYLRLMCTARSTSSCPAGSMCVMFRLFYGLCIGLLIPQ